MLKPSNSCLMIPVIVAGIFGPLCIGWYCYWQWLHPYGWSHSCDLQLQFALHSYADAHDGAYPAGEATPEASLSLLYPNYAGYAQLQGKTVPLEEVQAILESGRRLDPDSCGWHYVEGLRQDDDPRLALFWDKIGLQHNGQRRPKGGHRVFYVDWHFDDIDEANWEAFLQEQAKLHQERKVKKERNKAN